MPDILNLVSRWWKQMLVIIIISLVTVGAIVFFLPDKYLSVATALPANPALSDKSSVFNENVEALYPNIGTTEELDIILGTAQLDTAYLAVASTFNLWDHYKTEEKGEAAVLKAAYLLKQHTSVSKSGYGELKVKVWDTDKNLAPQLANAIMEQLNLIHQGIQNENNRVILEKLKTEIARIKPYRQDSNTIILPALKALLRHEIIGNLQQYEKLAAEYKLIVDANPPVLVIVERARPSPWPDKPKRTIILIATGVLGFIFSLLVALVIERRKKSV